MVKDDELLQSFKIWDKVSNITEKGFDSKPVYNGRYIKLE